MPTYKITKLGNKRNKYVKLNYCRRNPSTRLLILTRKWKDVDC